MFSTARNSSAPLPLLHFLQEQPPALCSFIAIRAIEELGSQMLHVAIAWYVYTATRDPMCLAYVGLARFLPNIGMALIAGQAADRFDRRRIIGLALFLQTLCFATLGLLLAAATLSAGRVYALLFVLGAGQAFSYPAMSAMLPDLAGTKEFPRAVAAASSALRFGLAGSRASRSPDFSQKWPKPALSVVSSVVRAGMVRAQPFTACSRTLSAMAG